VTGQALWFIERFDPRTGLGGLEIWVTIAA
jgi:hypothetical protein